VWPHLQYNALEWLSDANVFCRISARGSVSLALFRYSDIDVSLRWYETERRHKIPENQGAVRKAITSAEIGSCVLVCRFSFEFRFVSLRLSPFLSLYSSFVLSSPFLILADWTSFSRRHAAAGLHTLESVMRFFVFLSFWYILITIFLFWWKEQIENFSVRLSITKIHYLTILPNLKNVSPNLFAIQISFDVGRHTFNFGIFYSANYFLPEKPERTFRSTELREKYGLNILDSLLPMSIAIASRWHSYTILRNFLSTRWQIYSHYSEL